MLRILVLTAGFGDGHNTAARGIQESLRSTFNPPDVEVIDVFHLAYGPVNSLARYAYHGLIQHLPTLWGGLYRAFDRTAHWPRGGGLLVGARQVLADLLADRAPNRVVATYPAYGSLVQALYPDHRKRPFEFSIVITDSVTINAAWTAPGADFFCVPNEQTCAVLEHRGIERRRILISGFPVSPRFVNLAKTSADWEWGQPFRILYVLNHGTRRVVKTSKRLLRIPGVQLTIVTGRNRRLQDKLQRMANESDLGKLSVLGWTDRMPELMLQNHLVITKAGGATVQEALAAGKPVLLTQVVPGQEVGNAALVESLGLGSRAMSPKEVARSIWSALQNRGWLYRRWRGAVERHRRPAGAQTIADFLVTEPDRNIHHALGRTSHRGRAGIDPRTAATARGPAGRLGRNR